MAAARASPSDVRIRAAEPGDRERLGEMRHALWPEGGRDELDAEIPHMLADPDYLVLVADEGGRLVGFAEIGARSYAEGADGPAAYLEGIWVEASARRSGVARALLSAGEAWAKQRGFSHFGSDALIDNEISHAWHKAAGFAEVERLVVFAKPIR